MGSYFDIVFFAISDRLHYDGRISCVKATGHIGVIYQWQQFQVWSARIVSVLLLRY